MRRSLAALAGACLAAVGCYSLDVVAIQPTTSFTREQVLQKPELIELVVAGVFINFWGGATYAQPWVQLSLYGEEITTSANTLPNFNRGATQPIILWEFAQEPRGKFDNSLTGTSLFARDPWSNFYEANAAATDLPRLIKEKNLKIIDPATGQDNTLRVQAFAKFIQGLSHIHLAMLFDSAAVIDDSVDLSKIPQLPFVAATVVRDSGIKWLEDGIALAKTRSFVFPLKQDLWVYNTAVSNDEMAAISHSYIARALAYSARTPAERAAVNWAKVKSSIQQGVTAPFGPRGIPNPLISMDYRGIMSAPPQNLPAICNAGGTTGGINYCGGFAGAMRVDLRLLGPADTSGAYQEWLQKVSRAGFDTVTPFVVRTPDRRIQAQGSTTPLTKPTYFKYTDIVPPVTIMPTERGAYYYSNYWSSSRASNNNQQLPLDGGGRIRRTGDLNFIQDAMLLPAEMDLLLAEAEIRLGNPGAAVDLINKTRVGNGELPPVTVGGVPGGPGCVPRRYDGACGSLMDALMYEKRIETYGTAISYFDLRGWGCLAEGTPTQLPPPGRQLDLLGKPNYTYGGAPGAVGSAPKPTNCPLLHRP
ncbi:MAG: RagB/SusD family nutrient uptake outer membrane protein [Gemmatimonadota bacterium]